MLVSFPKLCSYNNHPQVSTVFNNTAFFLTCTTCWKVHSHPRVFFALRPTLNEQPLSETVFSCDRGKRVTLECHDGSLRFCSERVQNTSIHIFLATPDLNWGREIKTSPREMEQITRNNNMVFHSSLCLEGHPMSLLFCSLHNFQSCIITSFVKFSC